MSESTQYHVRTVYEVQTTGATSALDRLKGLFERISGMLGRLGSALVSLPTLIVAAFATGAVGAFLGQVMEVGGAAETTRLSLAGMINAQGIATATNATGDFARALQYTDTIVARMRTHARDLPGTFEDLRTVFQGGLMGGMQAGQSLARIEETSANLMAVGKSLGIDSEQIGRDFQLMMAGRAGAQVATFSRLSAQIGVTAQQFNAMSATQRWQAIERALRGFTPMVQAYGDSWEAVSSTTQDYAQSLFRLGSAPVFNALKNALKDLNDWIEHNRVALERLATRGGNALARYLGLAVEHLRAMGPMVERLARSPALNRFYEAAQVPRITSGQAMGGAAFAAGAAGLASGVPGLGLVFGALAAFTFHTQAVGAVLQEFARVGRSLLGLLGALYGMVVRVELGLGGLLAALAPGLVAGVGRVLTALIDYWRGLVSVIRATMDAFERGLSTLRGQNPFTAMFASLGRLVAALGGALSALLQLLARMSLTLAQAMTGPLGAVLSAMSSVAAVIWDGILRLLAWVFERLGSLLGWLNRLLSHLPGAPAAPVPPPAELVPSDGLTALLSRFGALMSGPKSADDNNPWKFADDTGWGHAGAFQGYDRSAERFREHVNAAAMRLGGATAARGNTHVTNHVQVHQTIEQADDPDRVLVATRDAVLDAMLHPIESHTAVVTR